MRCTDKERENEMKREINSTDQEKSNGLGGFPQRIDVTHRHGLEEEEKNENEKKLLLVRETKEGNIRIRRVRISDL